MRVFVTGASGFIGSAVVPELLKAGHQVTGLARSDASAEALQKAGAEIIRGDLNDLEALARGATEADGVIHLAYIHDFSQYDQNARIDYAAVETLGAALTDTGKPLIITGGVAALPMGTISTERDVVDENHPLRARSFSETLALSLKDKGVRSGTVRLSPTVHDVGDRGFLPAVIGIARAKGASAYIGDGAQRWPAVHRQDAATLYRLAIEKMPAGTVLHGVADEGVPIKTIAEIIGRHLDIPVTSIAPDNAMEHFGFLGGLLGADLPSSSRATQELLGWTPTHPGLVEDLEMGHYFTSTAGDMLH